MKMYFNFAETVCLKVGNHFDATTFVLLSGKEVCMPKWCAVVIADRVAGRPREFAPLFQLRQTIFSNSRLKMVGDDNDQMRGWWRRARTSSQFARTPKRIAREPRQRPAELFQDTVRIHVRISSRRVFGLPERCR